MSGAQLTTHNSQLTTLSGIDPLHRPRIRNGLSQMMDPADPGHEPFEAHPETGVREGAVTANVEIPLVGLFRELVLLQALFEELQIVDALRAADDLAVAFRREHVETEHDLGIFRVRLHVEGLDGRREPAHDQGLRRVRDERRFFVRSEVVAELDLEPLLSELVDRLPVRCRLYT